MCRDAASAFVGILGAGFVDAGFSRADSVSFSTRRPGLSTMGLLVGINVGVLAPGVTDPSARGLCVEVGLMTAREKLEGFGDEGDARRDREQRLADGVEVYRFFE
jgi:hypothetical protein